MTKLETTLQKLAYPFLTFAIISFIASLISYYIYPLLPYICGVLGAVILERRKHD